MRRRTVTVALALGLALAADAADAKPRPASVPAAPSPYRLIHEPCPGLGRSCVVLIDGSPVVFLSGPFLNRLEYRMDREHELGHVFDHWLMNDTDRGRARAILGYSQSCPWLGTPVIGSQSWAAVAGCPAEPAGERTATAYSACRLRLSPNRGTWVEGYRYVPRPAQHRAMCALFRDVARRAGGR